MGKGSTRSPRRATAEALEPRAYLAGVSFDPFKSFAVGPNPLSLAVADLNGDGIPDVVTGNRNATTVSVLLGNGDGTFKPQRTFDAGLPRYFTNAVAVADVNGDGKPDIVTSPGSYVPAQLTVLLGNGDGTFQARRGVATGGDPRDVKVADVNGDGKPDLVTALNLSGSAVGVNLGNGDGTFQAQRVFPGGGSTQSYFEAVADVNGDGKLDVVIADGSAGVGVLLGNGDGTFAPARVIPTPLPVYFVTTADVNGDGKPDLVVSAPSSASPAALIVLLGNGDGTFRDVATLNGPAGYSFRAVAAADFNGDGKLDLAAGGVGVFGLQIFLGNGDGSFAARVDFPSGSSTRVLVAADLNRDGVPDLVATDDNAPGAAKVFLNSTGAAPPTITKTGGAVVGVGTAFADTGSVAVVNGMVSVTIDGVTRAFDPAAVSSIALNVGAGDDSLTVAANVPPVTVAGGAGNDTIRGGGPGTVLKGGKGDDLLVGGKGAETLKGGAGSDTLAAGRGRGAMLSGGAGSDVFVNGSGSGDTIDGGAGLNFAQNNAGDTLLNVFEVYDPAPPAGGAAATVAAIPQPQSAGVTASVVVTANGPVLKVVGTAGDDTISVAPGGAGLAVTADGAPAGSFPLAGLTGVLVVGGAGNDDLSVDASVLLPATLRGGPGDDSLAGGGGDNVLVGGAGNDTLVGGANGTSLLVPGKRAAFTAGAAGNDSLVGGGGRAIADFSRRTDNLTLSNDGRADSGGAGETTTIAANITGLFGGTGNDTITAAAGGMFVSGGSGNDLVRGGGTANVLVGGAGADTVAAFAGGHSALFLRDGEADRYFADPVNDILQLDPGIDSPAA